MRLAEFTTDSNSISNLVTVLELLSKRYQDRGISPEISTQSLINMVINTDKNFDYAALVQANDTEPAVKNLIKSFNKDTVELNLEPGDDDDDTSTTTNTQNGDPVLNPVDTVSDMAKRAGKKRDSSIF